LGCAKNLVDSEVLMKQLDASGCTLIMDPSENDTVDTVIVNTCGFILDAKQESVDTILHFADRRKTGRLKRLFVMGCLSQRYKDQLMQEIPEVDEFFGVSELSSIVKRAGGEFHRQLLNERIITTPSHYSWLKIAEGCNRTCSYCSIPLIRGKHISKPLEEIVREAESLIRQGVREINVIAQDTTFYGLDLYKRRKLAELLARLASLKDSYWIRLLYTYPDHFPLEVLKVINNHSNICKYIDIPLQHISSRILRSMKRGMDTEKTLRLLETIREKIPGVAIRTTFIVGYPGETEKEFGQLREFVERSRFDRMGVFTYSHEEDTPAFRLKDDIPASVKQERSEELMSVQEEISLKLNQDKVGRIIKVIIDRKEGEYFVGRSESDAPEIDNEVLISAGVKDPEIGHFYDIRITSASHFDLFGQFHL
jgi:ribosomal protein S12 methylthiotransferase